MTPGAGGLPPMTIHVKVHDQAAKAEMKKARKEVNRLKRQALIEAGNTVFKRASEPIVPTPIREALIVRAAGNTGYLTTRGSARLNSIFELFNFGGFRNIVIRPKEKKALVINGAVRARVKRVLPTPMRWRGTHKIDNLVEARLPEYGQHLKRTVLDAFDGFES
jgi:hypothetical protein